jgi:hypothetical protein
MGVATSAPLDNLWFLRNQSGSFVEETRNVISQIDIGSQSVPSLANLDNDSDLDLLIGGSSGKLKFYENVGTRNDPTFERVTDSLGNIDVGGFSAPAVVDWDGDNDLDLLIGNIIGRIQYWRNDGDVANFAPILASSQLAALVNDTLKPIQTDQLAVPVPVDLNNDGLMDLVVGEWDFNGFANVHLYENIGSAVNPVLSLVTNRLIKREMRDFTIPRIYDWDSDGKKDLLVGGRYDGLTVYKNSAALGSFPDSLTLTKSSELIPGHDAGYYLAIEFSDIDDDGDDDIFLGEESGGVNFYRLISSSCCVGVRGDIDNNGVDATVLDLTYMINDIFRGGADPVCPGEADLDNDGAPSTVLDLTFLINRIYRGGPLTPLCP